MEKLMCKYDNQAIPKAMCFFDRESDTEPDDCKCCNEVCEEFNEKGCEECPIQEAFTKLAAYEAVIFSPDKLKEIDKMYLEKCEEVNRLRAELAELKRWKLLKKPTNADIIRGMSDEELATNMMCPNENGLAEIECNKDDSCNCYECLLQWLRSEVEEKHE